MRLLLTTILLACCLHSISQVVIWDPVISYGNPGSSQMTGDYITLDQTIYAYTLKITSSTNFDPATHINFLKINGTTYQFNSNILGWQFTPDVTGNLPIELSVIMPPQLQCGQSSVIHFELWRKSLFRDLLLDDSYVLFTYPSGFIAGPKAECGGTTASFAIVREINTSGTFTWSCNTAGWLINGSAPPVNTKSLTLNVTSPFGAPSQTSLTVQGGNLCSTLNTSMTSTTPSTPVIVTVGQAGQSCLFSASISPVQYTQNYTWQWNFGSSATYANSQTTSATLMPELIQANTQYWIRVKANNECGSSAWRYKSGTTPNEPEGCLKSLQFDSTETAEVLSVFPNPAINF